MKKRLISFVSMFLVVCMVISNIPVYAIAESDSKLGTSTSTETNLTTSKQEFNAASSSKVLDYVDKAEFESHKFVGRVLEDEELNSYVFQNEDGSRTAYFFSENVKYVDKDGVVQEKDISLTATRSGYSTTKNDVTASFSGSPSEGITIGYDKYSVTLKPIFTTRGVTASQKDNSVEYVGLFDSNTTLKYTPLLSGIKEDIVLTKYTGVNEYSFTLITNGLGVYESSVGYYLAESNKTKAIFYLGDVIAYDANLVPYEGTLTVETVKENQEYLITVSVDEAFLTDKNTVYPVTIDPTITIGDAYNTGHIQDAPIFSARPNSNHGTYEYDRVGTPSAEFGVGRTVIRLYGLINSSTYANLTANRITNVKFYAKEATGSATQTIKVYPLTNTSWTESGVTWNNVGSWSTTAICSVDMAYAQLTAFDITSLVKGWKNGTYAANAGFIMMSANESANKCFVSSEHSDTSRRPYVSMSYTAAISLNTTSIDLGEGDAVAMSVTVNPTGTTVTWSSTNPSIATVNSSGVVTGVKAGTATIKASMTTGGTTYTANCTVYVTIEDGVYYIQNQNSNKYLTTDGTVIGSPNVIQLYKYSEAGNSDAVRIRQMWKIKYLRDGQYSIRPMNKLDMGLDVTGVDVDTFTIGTNDQLDSILSTARWGISRVGTGFQITKQGIAGYSLQVQGDSTANNAEIIADDYMDVDSLYWNLIEVANPPSGVYLYDTARGALATNITRDINVGESKALTDLQLLPVAYSGTNINQSFTWSSSNATVATVNSSGTVTGVSSGIATITGYVYRNSTYYYLSYSVCVGVSFDLTMTKLNELYEVALEYDDTPRNAALLSLQFIRRSKYSEGNWSVVAGAVDVQFVDYVEDNYPLLYSHFTISANNNYYYLDPNGEGYVDFIHLCATLNGLMYNSTGFKAFIAGEENVNNLCGWAGDLQTLCIDVLEYTNYSNDEDIIYNATYYLIGNNAYSLSMADLLADTDAENICNLLNSSSSNFIYAFDIYYDNYVGDRYTNFVDGRSKQEIYNCVRKYTTNTFFLWEDWPLLEGYNITEIQSNAIAQAFTDFIWEKIEDER